MDEEFDINVRIYGRQNRLHIKRSEELIFRDAAKVLNERIDYYTNRFSLEYTDVLTMVAYEFAVEYERIKAGYHSSPSALLGKYSDIILKELGEKQETSGSK